VCVCVRASEFVHDYAFALSNINTTQDVNYTNDRERLSHSKYAAFDHCTVYTLPIVYELCAFCALSSSVHNDRLLWDTNGLYRI
jgi:hypothetical protein